MARPLYPLLWAFIAGILLEHYGQRSASHYSTFLLLYALLGVLYMLCHRRNAPRLSSLILLICALFVGMTRYAMFRHLPVNHISHFVRNDLVTIEGSVTRPPETREQKRYLTIQTTALEQGTNRYHVTGKVRLILTGNRFGGTGEKIFDYGDMLRIRLRLRLPRNPAGFDYRAFLRRRGIFLIGTLPHDRHILPLHKRGGSIVLRWIYRLQRRLLHFLDFYAARHRAPYTDQAIQILKALTLGQNRTISHFIRDRFRDAGMYHFLVVSGVHVGILAWACHAVFKRCDIPKRYRGILMTGILLIYAGLTGFQFPVLRAVIMVLVFYLSIICQRKSDSLYSLAVTAAIILLLFPASAFEASFQMTVAATASILLFVRCAARFSRLEWLGFQFKSAPHVRTGQRDISSHHTQWPFPLRILRYLSLIFLASFAAILGISPLTAYYFEQIYPASLLTNLLAFPLVNLLLPTSLLTIFCSLLLPWIWLSFLMSCNLFLAGFFLQLASTFPDWSIPLPRPSVLIILLYYLTLYRLLTLYKT